MRSYRRNGLYCSLEVSLGILVAGVRGIIIIIQVNLVDDR